MSEQKKDSDFVHGSTHRTTRRLFFFVVVVFAGAMCYGLYLVNDWKHRAEGLQWQVDAQQALIDAVVPEALINGCEPSSSVGSKWCGMVIERMKLSENETLGDSYYVVRDYERKIKYVYEAQLTGEQLKVVELVGERTTVEPFMVHLVLVDTIRSLARTPGWSLL
jgi:hypothetical protein